MTKKRLFFIGIAGLILVFLWPLLNNFIPLIKEWTNAKHDQAFLREVFKHISLNHKRFLIKIVYASVVKNVEMCKMNMIHLKQEHKKFKLISKIDI